MAFISSPGILQTKNAGGAIVVAANTALRFVGATVTADSPTQTAITIGGGPVTSWALVGNVLTGGSPTTPNQVLGSTNDFDVRFIRNDIDIFRLIAAGLELFNSAGANEKNIIVLDVDPTVGPGVPAAIGSIGLRNNGGVGELWRKVGAANTAWNFPSTGGGNPNTIGYYDAIGVLTSNASAKFNDAQNAFAYGIEATGGTVTAGGNGGLAHGDVSVNGTISSTGAGAVARGSAVSQGQINAGGLGAQAYGSTNGVGSIIQATSPGSEAAGIAGNNNQITANAQGAKAFGVTNGGAGAAITASGAGSISHGEADGTCTISTTAGGAVASGSAGAGTISATSAGAEARGTIITSGNITASGVGAKAFGRADQGNITATQDGALSFGSCVLHNITSSGAGSIACGAANGGDIVASGTSSFAHGFAVAAGITASGNGSYARGFVQNGPVIASGSSSFAHGDFINVSSDLGASFGLGITNSSYQALIIGQYNKPIAYTPGTTVATDPAFLIGNGTGVGLENDSFRIDKDGRITTTAANRIAARVAVGNDVISARTDYKVVYNAGAGAFTITLPTGEQGLEFVLATASTNTGTFTIGGPDPIDANVQAVFNSGSVTPITFIGGTWYAI